MMRFGGAARAGRDAVRNVRDAGRAPSAMRFVPGATRAARQA